MPKRRTSTAMAVAAQALAEAVHEEQLEVPTSEDGADPEVAESVLEGLRRLDQGGGSRMTWYVYDDSIDNGGYIEKLRTEQLDEDLFKKRYGPGEYRVVGRANGQYVKGSSSGVKISGVMSEPRRPVAGRTGAPESDALALMREMQAANDRRAQQRAEDGKHWAQAIAVPLATVAAAFISRPRNDIAALVTALRPQQSTLGEMTQALLNLQSLQGEKSNTVDVLLKVLDKVNDMPQSAASEGGWLGLVRDVIREAAPHAREIMSRMNTSPPPGALLVGAPLVNRPETLTGAISHQPTGTETASSPPTQNGASAQQAPNTTAPSGSPDMWSIAEPWLRRRAEELHEDAAANMDVELVAETLLERARKRFGSFVSFEQLGQLLQHPQWWELLTGFYPALIPYQAWVNDVRQQLLAMVADELGQQPPAEPAPEGPRQ